MSENKRIDGVINRILDTATDELEQAGVDGVRAVIHALKDWLWVWIPTQFEKLKEKQSDSERQEMTLDDLNEMIATHERTMALGREQEKIKVCWAMKKLNYSEDQIKQVFDLAEGEKHPKQDD